MSFIIGLLLAFGLNVDVFYMVNSLSKNPKLAANISGVASNVWESNKDAFDEYAEDCINTPNGQNSNEQCQEKLESFKNSLQSKIESELESQPLEVDNTTIDDLMFWQNKEKQNGFLRIFGILISAIAIAMGAPFWFDLLGKFINVRNAGKAIQPKPKESSSSNTPEI
jgi:hypothetical protein